MNSIEDCRILDKNTAGRIDGYSIDVLKKGERGFLRICAAGGCWMGMKPLSPGNWYHISVVFVSIKASDQYKILAGVFFFVNGEKDYEVPFPISMFGLGRIAKNILPVRIGRAAVGGNFWNGLIDDVSIWDIPLTLPQIRRLMYQRLSGNEKGLVGYWSFNEGSGTTTVDHTPNRAHGTVYGDEIKWIPSEEKDLILNDCI